MAVFSNVIAEEHDGFTVRDYLRKVMGISSRQIKKLKALPLGILVNGKHAIVIDKLSVCDTITISTGEEEKQYDVSAVVPDILYEDDNYIVVNKPFNMTVYLCGKVENNLLSSVCGYYSSIGRPIVFRPFYRIDKDTSGLVVLAKNALVMNSTVIEKEYYAVCQGKVPEKGVVSGAIKLKNDSRIMREVNPSGVPSVTDFFRVDYDGTNSLVKLKLETGRTHQIRVHMSYLGYPLCGDDLYYGKVDYIRRQALHCKNVRISNDMLGLSVKIDSPFPSDMVESFPELCKN